MTALFIKKSPCAGTSIEILTSLFYLYINKLPVRNCLFFFLVICILPRKITTMTKKVATVLKSIKVPGGTGIVTSPISTVYILMAHSLRLPMESFGITLEDISIH